MLLSIMDRRVPQLVGVYLAASWGCVEFSDFAVNQFALSPAITNLVVLGLGLLLPVVIFLAWRHGAPGGQVWTKVDGAAIGLNLVVAAGVLIAVFGGQELGAATTVKLVEDAEGNTVERVLPKAEFRRNVLLYRFDNQSNDPDLDWLGMGLTTGVGVDLAQDMFVTAIFGDETVSERLAESGFGWSDRIPLPLKREAAELRNLDYFLVGSFSVDGGALVVETSLYDTRNARVVETHGYRGSDPLVLADAISLDLRRDLGIPDWQIDAAIDLPAVELITSVPEAYRSFVEGQLAAFDNDVTQTRAKSEEAIARDSTFAYAYFNAAFASLQLGDPAAGNNLLASANRYLYRLPERQRLAIQAFGKWLFQQDPAGGLQAAKYWTEVYPQDAEARRLAGIIASASGDHDEMMTQFRALLAIDPANVGAMRDLASAFSFRLEYDSALVYSRQVVEERPSDVQARLQLASALGNVGQYGDARAELESASVAVPSDPDPLDGLARLDMREGLYDAAADRTEQVRQLARTPLERERAAGLRETYYFNRGQFGLLVDTYRERLAALTEFRPVFSIVQQLDNSEALRFAALAGRDTWALDQIDSLSSLVDEPFDLELQEAAVRIHLALGNLEGARGSLAALRRRAESFGATPGDDAFTSWVEGEIMRIEDGDCSRAQGYYDRAVEGAPLAQGFRASRMTCYAELQQWRQAQAEADWLIERNPGNALWRLAIARYYAARADTARAIEHLEVATDIWSQADPDYIPAQEARALLAELREA